MEMDEPLDLVPVDIFHEPDHKFVNGDGKGCHYELAGGKRCGRAKNRPLHYGAVPSLNDSGSGANRFAYQAAKAALEERLAELLEGSDLPKGLNKILVEGEMCFPNRIRRDQGNFRYFVEKCLGDCLQSQGYLPDDSWDHYEFGNLTYRYEKGVTWTRLILFPS